MCTYNSVVARIVLVDLDLDQIWPRVRPPVAAGLAAEAEGGRGVAVGEEDAGNIELGCGDQGGEGRQGEEEDHSRPGHSDHLSLSAQTPAEAVRQPGLCWREQ